jgi:hypothetical protein
MDEADFFAIAVGLVIIIILFILDSRKRVEDGKQI